MLLLIDQDKIKAQLADKPTSYTVVVCNLEMPTPRYEVPSVTVSGAITEMPSDLLRARERLFTLRQSLRNRGIRPLSPEELDKNIDEMRGRS